MVAIDLMLEFSAHIGVEVLYRVTRFQLVYHSFSPNDQYAKSSFVTSAVVASQIWLKLPHQDPNHSVHTASIIGSKHAEFAKTSSLRWNSPLCRNDHQCAASSSPSHCSPSVPLERRCSCRNHTKSDQHRSHQDACPRRVPS